MALAAPGRSGGSPIPGARMRAREIAASAQNDGGSPREARFRDIIVLDSNTGSPDWRRPGFVFSARVGVRLADGRLALEAPFGRLSVRGGGVFLAFSSIRLRVEREGGALVLRFLGYGSDKVTERDPLSRTAPDAALLRALGLHADSLSIALLSFARGFGLPIDAALLRRLRRSALRSTADREAASLAAVAAEAKGVRLTSRALEEYVGAIDVNAGRDEDGRRAGGEEGRSSTGAEGESREKGETNDEKDRKRGRRPPCGDDVRSEFAASCSSGDALSYLNALPGPDGARWVVFPVNLGTGDVEIRAVVRILLLAAHEGDMGRVGRWAVDVVAGGRTWFFDAEAAAPLSPVQVSAEPPLGAEAPRVRSALEVALGPFGHTVRVSAETDERRFRERASQPYAVVNAEV